MKAYIVSLCFALLLGVAVNILVPSKKYEGIMKILCGIFLISTVISPLINVFSPRGTRFETNRYFKDDDGFNFRISGAKEKFRNILKEKAQKTAEKITDDVTFRTEDGKIYVTGIDEYEKDFFKKQMNEAGFDVIFED